MQPARVEADIYAGQDNFEDATDTAGAPGGFPITPGEQQNPTETAEQQHDLKDKSADGKDVEEVGSVERKAEAPAHSAPQDSSDSSGTSHNGPEQTDGANDSISNHASAASVDGTQSMTGSRLHQTLAGERRLIASRSRCGHKPYKIRSPRFDTSSTAIITAQTERRCSNQGLVGRSASRRASTSTTHSGAATDVAASPNAESLKPLLLVFARDIDTENRSFTTTRATIAIEHEKEYGLVDSNDREQCRGRIGDYGRSW